MPQPPLCLLLGEAEGELELEVLLEHLVDEGEGLDEAEVIEVLAV